MSLRGTTNIQDPRFKDKVQDVLKKVKFPKSFDVPVDTSKVELDVMKSWIEKRLVEVMGFEDELVIEYVIQLLEEGGVLDGKKMYISLAGFLETNTMSFMTELWELLVDAQSNPLRVPQKLLDAKKEELRLRREIGSTIDDMGRAAGRGPREDTRYQANRADTRGNNDTRGYRGNQGYNDQRDSGYNRKQDSGYNRSRDSGYNRTRGDTYEREGPKSPRRESPRRSGGHAYTRDSSPRRYARDSSPPRRSSSPRRRYASRSPPRKYADFHGRNYGAHSPARKFEGRSSPHRYRANSPPRRRSPSLTRDDRRDVSRLNEPRSRRFSLSPSPPPKKRRGDDSPRRSRSPVRRSVSPEARSPRSYASSSYSRSRSPPGRYSRRSPPPRRRWSRSPVPRGASASRSRSNSPVQKRRSPFPLPKRPSPSEDTPVVTPQQRELLLKENLLKKKLIQRRDA